MPLPEVQGWLIDFRTADFIFRSKSNLRISHLVARCQSGLLRICHQEEENFRSFPSLKRAFLSDQNCVFEPDEDVYNNCETIAENPICRGILTGNKPAILITAIATCSQFGVISNNVSPSFITVHDLCSAYGIPIFTAEQYFALL